MSGKTGLPQRSVILDDFRAGKCPVLINCGTLVEGADLPCVNNLTSSIVCIPADISGRCPDLGAAHPFRDQDEADGKPPGKQLKSRSDGECEPRSPLAR